MIVNSYQEAETLYSASRDECREYERRFQDAIAEVEQAVWKYQMARNRLTMAEMRVGKARSVIRKNGFEEVLHIRSRMKSRNSMSSSCLSSSRSD
jgi:DNA repair ATPase RecN